VGKGVFVTFEGVEGSGKSTQIRLLEDGLKKAGYTVTVTREPGGTTPGEALRKIALDPDTGKLDPLTELFIFSAARRELISRVIVPALSAGHAVLLDRFADSTTAYQGYARGLNLEMMEYLSRHVTQGAWPDRTIVLDVDVHQGLKRSIARMADEGSGAEARFEEESLDFHRRVRDGYLQIAKKDPQRVQIINPGTVDEVQRAVFSSVAALFPRLVVD
jgi:dTMP kinase